jgi:hypothetical protein
VHRPRAHTQIQFFFKKYTDPQKKSHNSLNTATSRTRLASFEPPASAHSNDTNHCHPATATNPYPRIYTRTKKNKVKKSCPTTPAKNDHNSLNTATTKTKPPPFEPPARALSTTATPPLPHAPVHRPREDLRREVLRRAAERRRRLPGTGAADGGDADLGQPEVSQHNVAVLGSLLGKMGVFIGKMWQNGGFNRENGAKWGFNRKKWGF